MRARTERQAGVEIDQTLRVSRIIELRALAPGADPQASSETHGMEVLQPLALPRAVGDLLELRVGEQGAQCIGIGGGVEQRLDADARPQRRRSRRGTGGPRGGEPGGGSSTGWSAASSSVIAAAPAASSASSKGAGSAEPID